MKILGKSWIMVSKQAKKQPGGFLPSRREGSNFQILLVCFFLNHKLPQPKVLTGVWFCGNEGPWKFWAKTLLWFPNQPPPKHLVNIFPAAKNGRKLKFYWFVLSKRQIARTKNFQSSFILWHWRAMKSLGKNWTVVSNAGQNKWVNLFAASGKSWIFKLYWLVFCKRQVTSTKNFHRSLLL